MTNMKSEFPISTEHMVVTSDYVTKQGMPILYVSRETDEEGAEFWQFHCGNEDYSMERMMLVRLSTILRIDETVSDVSDLPMNHFAKRENVSTPWSIEAI